MTDAKSPDSGRSIEPIERLVRRVALRIRLGRAVDRAVTGAAIGLLGAMVALSLSKTGWIEGASLTTALILAALVPVGLAVWGWVARVDRIALAQRIDQTHGLHDRLSTALSLSGEDSLITNDHFSRAQIEDALRHTHEIDVARAAPFARPADVMPLAICVAAVAGLWIIQLPNHIHPLPLPPQIVHDAVLDSATVAIERDRLKELQRTLGERGGDDVKELLDEIEKLLDAVENRELTEAQFLEKIAEIEAKFFGDEDAPKDQFAEALKRAAEALTKEAGTELAKQEEFKAVIDALEQTDLARASEAMKSLAEKLLNEDLSAEQAEQLAKLLENFADMIDVNDPALQKLLEQHEKLIEELSKKFDGGSGGTEQEKQRLDRAREEAEKIKRSQVGGAESKEGRDLKRLAAGSKEMAEKLKKHAEQQRQNKEKPDPNQPDYKNEVGRAADQASKELEQSSQDQRSSDVKGDARQQLEELREALKRAEGRSQEDRQSEERRGEQVRDFLERARGESEQEAGDEQQGGRDEGGDGQSDQRGEAESRDRGQTGPESQAGERPESGQDDGSPGENKGLSDGQGDPNSKDDSAGTERGDPAIGEEETSLDSRRQDERVKGEQGKGQSRSEIIRGASEDGFATTEYKDVYVDYSSVVEEVMEREKVPSGYRYYVKRYFQLIKPQE